jgi:hypothetical protein
MPLLKKDGDDNAENGWINSNYKYPKKVRAEIW